MPPHRPRGHGRPQGANHIDLRYSADALKAISDLQLGSRPRAILKIHPPSSLDYRARHGLQTSIHFNDMTLFVTSVMSEVKLYFSKSIYIQHEVKDFYQ